jgi:eukaryotic-like serine/threonine-protein kinase
MIPIKALSFLLMDGAAGRLVGGRYRLDAPLGRGGMGVVWRARDELLHREVAVKEVLLHPGLSPQERAVACERMQREARLAAGVRHPAVLTVFDVVNEDDRPWIVMELIDGRSLEQVVLDGGPLDPRQVARIGRELLGALSAAHATGVLHRDVKPANVLLARDGRVLLTDFGIATWEGATSLTQSGAFVGSPGYVAPEVALGEQPGPGADLWSLGATLYMAVEGRPPYAGATAMATLSALLTSDPPAPFRAGPLRPVLAGLLQRDWSGRASRNQVEHMLDRVCGDGRAQDDLTTEARGVPQPWAAGSAGPAGGGAGGFGAPGPAGDAGWPHGGGPVSSGRHAVAGSVSGSGSRSGGGYHSAAGSGPSSKSWLTEGTRGPRRRRGLIAAAAGLAALVVVAGVLVYVLRPAGNSSAAGAGPGTGTGTGGGAVGRSSAPAADATSPAAAAGSARPTPRAVALLLARLLKQQMAGHVIGYGGGTGALPGASRTVTGVVTWLDGRTVSIAMSLNWPRGHGRHLDRADSSCSVVSSRNGSHKTVYSPRSASFCYNEGSSILALWLNISHLGLPLVRPWVTYSDTVIDPSGFWMRLTYCSCTIGPGGVEKPAAFVNPSLLNDARAGILIHDQQWQPTLSRPLIAAGAKLPGFRRLPARTLMIVPP